MDLLISWSANSDIFQDPSHGWKIWVTVNINTIFYVRYRERLKPMFRIIITTDCQIYGCCSLRETKGFSYLPIWVMENSVNRKCWDSHPFMDHLILNWMILTTMVTPTFYIPAEIMQTTLRF